MRGIMILLYIVLFLPRMGGLGLHHDGHQRFRLGYYIIIF